MLTKLFPCSKIVDSFINFGIARIKYNDFLTTVDFKWAKQYIVLCFIAPLERYRKLAMLGRAVTATIATSL